MSVKKNDTSNKVFRGLTLKDIEEHLTRQDKYARRQRFLSSIRWGYSISIIGTVIIVEITWQPIGWLLAAGIIFFAMGLIVIAFNIIRFREFL